MAEYEERTWNSYPPAATVCKRIRTRRGGRAAAPHAVPGTTMERNDLPGQEASGSAGMSSVTGGRPRVRAKRWMASKVCGAISSSRPGM